MPTFTVYGHPATKGSTVSFMGDEGKIITKTDSDRLKAWTRDVQWAARAAKVKRIAKPHGVKLTVRFAFLRPSSAPADRLYPTVPPDLDKTLRATLDSLSNGLGYDDDSQVVDISAIKVYGEAALTTIQIEAV